MFVLCYGSGACKVQVSQTHKIFSNADCTGHGYTDPLPLLSLDLKLILEVQSWELSMGNSLPIPPLQSQPHARMPKVHLTRKALLFHKRKDPYSDYTHETNKFIWTDPTVALSANFCDPYLRVALERAECVQETGAAAGQQERLLPSGLESSDQKQQRNMHKYTHFKIFSRTSSWFDTSLISKWTATSSFSHQICLSFLVKVKPSLRLRR